MAVSLSVYPDMYNMYDVVANPNYDFLEDSEHELSFYGHGCHSEDEKSKNCTAACTNATLVFGSPDTFQNCILYPSIYYLVSNNSLADGSLANANKFDIGKANITSNISTILSKCFSSYCNVTSSCVTTLIDGSFNLSDPESYFDSSESYFDNDAWYFTYLEGADNINQAYLDTICGGNVSATLDPDIGGIGVYVSYWMQSIIAIFGFALLKFWTSYIYYLYLGIFLWPCGFENAKNKAHRYKKASRDHLPALVSALVDFQKAQCFFIMAVVIAAQIVISKGLFQANSLQQLWNNYALISSISISGMLPVILILLGLYSVGIKSWYLFTLSTCTVFLSAATLYTARHFNPKLSLQPASSGHADCGGKSPATFCLSPGSVDTTSTRWMGGTSVFVFSILILTSIFIDQSRIFYQPWFRRVVELLHRVPKILKRYVLQCQYLFQLRLNSCRKRTDLIDRYSDYIQGQFHNLLKWFQSSRRWLKLSKMIKPVIAKGISGSIRFFQWAELNSFRTWKRIITKLVFLGISIMFMIFFVAYFRQLAFFISISAVSRSSWSFGQIVGMTVWIPAIIEYANLEIQGMAKGSKHRILKPYQVVKITQKTSVNIAPAPSVIALSHNASSDSLSGDYSILNDDQLDPPQSSDHPEATFDTEGADHLLRKLPRTTTI